MSTAAAPARASQPGVRIPTDALARHWLRQVTLRLRREVAWCGTSAAQRPRPDAAALPPPTDPRIDSLDLARYRDDKQRFFAHDVDRSLPQRAQIEPRRPTGRRRRRRGSLGVGAPRAGARAGAQFVLALRARCRGSTRGGPGRRRLLERPGAALSDARARAAAVGRAGRDRCACAEPRHALYRHGLLERPQRARPRLARRSTCPRGRRAGAAARLRTPPARLRRARADQPDGPSCRWRSRWRAAARRLPAMQIVRCRARAAPTTRGWRRTLRAGRRPSTRSRAWPSARHAPTCPGAGRRSPRAGCAAPTCCCPSTGPHRGAARRPRRWFAAVPPSPCAGTCRLRSRRRAAVAGDAGAAGPGAAGLARPALEPRCRTRPRVAPARGSSSGRGRRRRRPPLPLRGRGDAASVARSPRGRTARSTPRATCWRPAAREPRSTSARSPQAVAPRFALRRADAAAGADAPARRDRRRR